MTIYTVNEHRIDVPDDMRVVLEQDCAGGYDHIVYRGEEICTQELEEEPEIYTGSFGVILDGDIVSVDSLDAARTLIDEYKENILAPFRCKDCDVNTSDIDEYYMVTDEVWQNEAQMAPHGGMLCIGCLEKRIGRTLVPADFPAYPVNSSDLFCQSERLASRINCEEVRKAA